MVRDGGNPGWDIAASISLLHGVHPLTFPSVVPGGWSIGDEMLFYLVFPLLAFVLTTWARSAIALIAAYAAAAWWWRHGYNLMLPLGFSRKVTSDFTFGWLLMQMPAFLSGFLAFHTIRAIGAGRNRWIAEGVLVCAILGLAAQIYIDFQYTPRISVLFGVAAAAMGIGAGRYLVNRVITYIGKVSYSAYLIHFSLLGNAAALVSWLGWSGLPALAAALVFVGVPTIAIATITYRLIELPMIRLGRRASAWVASPKSPPERTAERSTAA